MASCSIKSIFLFAGPFLLPKAIAYYRSFRASSRAPGLSIRPVPPNVLRVLILLTITALIFLLRSLSIFAPENIFTVTSSRLQTPTDVLFTRLSTLRPLGLNPSDDILRTKINSMESRLLFFQFGPDVITNCQFCSAEDSKYYLYYALPGIFGPHLINLVILSLVTSGLLSGKEGARWRNTATILAAVLAVAEVYLVSTFNHQSNAQAKVLEQITFFHWNMRMYRSIGLATLDALIVWGLWMSSTNRAFIVPPLPAESIEFSLRMLDSARGKMGAVGILRNTINRDENLRERGQDYWRHEVRITRDVMEEREVVDSINNAMVNGLNIANISAEAQQYAENFIMPMQMPGANGAI